LFEFTSRTDAAKKRALKSSKKYYYLYFIGTRTDRRKMGLCSTLVGELQDIARKDGCPLWLEATTAYSRDIYERLGFEIIEEIVLGQGQVGEDGLRKKGGEGVRVWGMIWRPEDEEKKMKDKHDESGLQI
jgi:ribosomal protein S18 acetylase RimI-like enzyme